MHRSGFESRRAPLRTLLLFVAATVFPGVAVAQANQIQLGTVESTNPAGDPVFDVDVSIDFVDFAVGGGITIDFDASRLEFVSFEFDPAGPTHLLDGPAPGDPSQPIEFGGGWFTPQPPFGVNGLKPLGTVTFRGVSEGDAVIAVSDGSVRHGPFVGPNGNLTIQDASVTVSIPTAPPAAVPSFGHLWGLVTLLALLVFSAYRAQLQTSESA